MRQIRILEIDATPNKVPSEVQKLLQPILEGVHVHSRTFEMKVGELHDADFPRSHSSYYVAAMYVDGPEAVIAAEGFLKMVTESARSMHLPIVEIMPEHPELAILVEEFGW
jgi:hypothetical protein